MKAFTYVSWLDGNLGEKQGWVSRATTEAEDVKRFMFFPWFAAMNSESRNMYTKASHSLSSIF